MSIRPTRMALFAATGLGIYLGVRALGRRVLRYRFRDKVALITGGSRGLGLVMARELAQQGAKLAICARDAAELQRAAEDLKQRGAEVLPLTCDITDRIQVERMVHDVVAQYGRIDVLINNAGVIQAGPLEAMDFSDFEEAMRVHFWGPLYTIQAALPEMRRRHEGRIVNISSIGGAISVPHLLPYCASKFALTGLSEGLHAELVKDGIVVTTVRPGMMRTGSPRNAKFKGRHRDEYTWFSISDSLPLISMSAERAARTILSACQRGDAQVTVSLPAKLAETFHGLFPGATADLMGLINRFLPGPGGIGTQQAKGSESTSRWSPSWLTFLTERAVARNNQLP
jgi:NAD(P)-dependent dehydrogenase (short-subunit alcohol dehydrogenase family)